MNKREKEILQDQLNSEKKVLKQLEKQYRAALDEINDQIRLLQSKTVYDSDGIGRNEQVPLNLLPQSRIYQIEHQKALRDQINGILDKLHGNEYQTISDYLQDCYTDAFVGTAYDLAGQGIPLILPIDQAAAVKAIQTDSKISEGLYDALGVDTKNLKKAIAQEATRGVASGLTFEDIARNIQNVSKAPFSNAKRIARTEGHRIQQASTMDAQKAAKAKGADVVKQWDGTLDGKTRKTHRKLDGQIREVDEPFEIDGKKAMFPGDFGDPAEDCNCRCASLTRARWGLDESELDTLKERAKFFGLDKTKDFDDFKEKYLKADNDMKAAQIEQDRIKERREAYKKRQAEKNAAEKLSVPDFESMKPAEIKKWADEHLKTNFENVSGVNKDFLQETVKSVAAFENKMGGKTVEGLSVKFGGVHGNAYAQYDDKTKTLTLKKTGNLKAFEEKQKEENARYRAKWKKDKDYHATTTYSGTVFHELGHAIDADSGQSLSRILSTDPDLFESSVKVSAYAGSKPSVGSTPRSEAWAENFAAYMEGGESAKKVPGEIVDMIEDYFNRKK